MFNFFDIFNTLISFIVHIIGTFENKVFDDREISFTVGEGSDQDVISGVEIAIEKFKQNEKSRITIKPKHAFGSKGSEKYNIPPNATVQYEITLKNFERLKESWALDSKERIEQSLLFKEKGTNYFKSGKYDLALKLYKKILSYLESDTGM